MSQQRTQSVGQERQVPLPGEYISDPACRSAPQWSASNNFAGIFEFDQQHTCGGAACQSGLQLFFCFGVDELQANWRTWMFDSFVIHGSIG